MGDYEDIDYKDIIEMIYEELNKENKKNTQKDLIKIYNLADDSIPDLKLEKNLNKIVEKTLNKLGVKDIIYRSISKYMFIFCLYDMGQMSKIYSSNELLRLNRYNTVNSKDASRKLKKAFEKNSFALEDEHYIFYGYEHGKCYKWTFYLFDVLGIKFGRKYFSSLRGKEKFFEYFFIPLLLSPVEMKLTIENFGELYSKYSPVDDKKEIEEVYEAICNRKELPNEFYSANCWFIRKKGTEDERRAYEKVASIKEMGNQWEIYTPILMSSKYYNERIKRKSKEEVKYAIDYIPVSEKVFEKIGGVIEKNKYFIEISIENIEKASKDCPNGWYLGNNIQYNLTTEFPQSIFEPVYDATFYSIMNNPFFNSSGEIRKLSPTKLFSYYDEYYLKLNSRLEGLKDAMEECYWLSEKIYGINILKKIIDDVVNGKVENVTNGEKTGTKLHFTSRFIEFVNRLSEITISELRFFYWELFATKKMKISTILECINLLDEDEIQMNCVQYFKRFYINNEKIEDTDLEQFVRNYSSIVSI